MPLERLDYVRKQHSSPAGSKRRRQEAWVLTLAVLVGPAWLVGLVVVEDVLDTRFSDNLGAFICPISVVLAIVAGLRAFVLALRLSEKELNSLTFFLLLLSACVGVLAGLVVAIVAGGLLAG